MNASYQVGLTYLNTQMRRALGTCTNPDLFFEKNMARLNILHNGVDEMRRRSSLLAAKRLARSGSINEASVTRIKNDSGLGGGADGAVDFTQRTSAEFLRPEPAQADALPSGPPVPTPTIMLQQFSLDEDSVSPLTTPEPTVQKVLQ